MLTSNKNNGFTLLELMITIGIAGILLGLAVPSFYQTIQNNRMTTQTNELIAGLNYARLAAISEGTEVFMCHSLKPNAATPACGGTGSSWNRGFIIYAKPVNNATSTYTYNSSGTATIPADTLLKQVALQDNPNYDMSSPGDTLGFNNLGFSFPSAVYKFELCDDSRTGEVGSTITISVSGRISRQEKSCT